MPMALAAMRTRRWRARRGGLWGAGWGVMGGVLGGGGWARGPEESAPPLGRRVGKRGTRLKNRVGGRWGWLAGRSWSGSSGGLVGQVVQKRPPRRLHGGCAIATRAYRPGWEAVASVGRAMEFRILGPLEVGGEFGAVALVGIKPRAV